MNVFDQYEKESQTSKSVAIPNVQMSSSGYLRIDIEPDVPIFTKSKKDFTPIDRITHVAISNKFLVVVMANNVMFRMDLTNHNENEEITLPKDNKVTNLFLDPYGFHTILACGTETYYLSRKMKTKLRPLSAKFGNNKITQVAWCVSNEADNKTGPILLGTSKGLILETEIQLDCEKYWKQVFDIGKGTNTPITGLQYYNMPGTEKYFIFATTPKRFYYFSGMATNRSKPPILQQVFNRYLSIPEIETFVEQGDSKHSQIRFWSENLCTPNSIAWLTSKGIFYAQIDSDTLYQSSAKELNEKFTLIEYPKFGEKIYDDAFTLLLTEFHVLIAYHNCIRGLSVVNGELIYEDNYNEAFGRLVNVIRDYVTGTVWAVTEKSLFRFRVKNEERNLWQIYSDRQEYELAKKYAKNNEVFYNEVLIREATMHFDKGEYNLSAMKYAETQSSFEEICLKFIQSEQQDALKLFLRKKLDNLNAQDKTQITMIALWLIELYLTQMEELRLKGLELTNEYYQIQDEFQRFLATPRLADCVKKNKGPIYNLMASHGDKSNAIKLTIINKDFKSLIRQHIYKNAFGEALDVLKSQKNRELFYQFAPILIQEIPKLVVKTLKDQRGNLQPAKLLPALVSCQGEAQSKEVIGYLEFCINSLKCPEKAVHNLLISLYAKYEPPSKLLEYLNEQGQNVLCINYDVHFALRLCQEHQITAACVQLSCLLGLWESAVDMGLTISQEIAINVANQAPENDVELRKKLWLKIAQHVISGKDDIQTAMEFLKSCDDLIRIEDILTFFSDFVTIDHFKEAICNSLKKYNHDIEELKKEMDEATVAAETVRKEIQSFRNKYTHIKPTDLCEICQMNILVRPFYIFPCRHRFHADCLTKELKPLLGPAKRNKLADLQFQLNMVNKQTIDNISTGSTGLSSRDIVRNDIDNIVASECLYCGENMIRNIDQPFYFDSEFEQILKDWE